MTSLTSKILVVGGSFGGMSTIKAFVKKFQQSKPNVNVEIFLIDPRAGFINVLAIPQAIIDLPFAKSSYAKLEDFNLKFDSIDSTNLELVEKAKNAKITTESIPSNLKLHFLHGKCIKFIDDKTISYKLNGDDSIKNLKFDYAVYSAGRSRNWPFDPKGETQNQFLEEVKIFKEKVDKAQKISVIGGGALGIEVAGALKELYNNKDITLIHPHPFLPPEVLTTKEFKKGIADGIVSQGINLKLNTRIKEESSNGDLITTNGEIIKTDLPLWCNFHKNNIEPLLPYFQDSIDPKTKEVIVGNNFLIKNSQNVFAVGDVTNLPIFKVAHAAFRSGIYVAGSLYNLIVDKKQEYETIDLERWPDKITVVVGTTYSVNQDPRGISINDERSLAMYKDYRNNNLLYGKLNFIPEESKL